MLKLFKYELRKTLTAKWIILGITAALEALFLFGTFTNNVNTATIACVLLLLDALFGVIFIGIRSVAVLHSDMNTKQGYMLFMTPHNNYAILGAKALECVLSIVIASLFFFALGALDIMLLFKQFGNIQSLMDFVQQMVNTMNMNLSFNTRSIACFVTQTAASWISTVMIAFLADVIACALLRGKKVAGFLSYVFFLALYYAVSKLIGLIPATADMYTDMLIRAAAMMVISVICCISTATIMEKKLSV